MIYRVDTSLRLSETWCRIASTGASSVAQRHVTVLNSYFSNEAVVALAIDKVGPRLPFSFGPYHSARKQKK